MERSPKTVSHADCAHKEGFLREECMHAVESQDAEIASEMVSMARSILEKEGLGDEALDAVISAISHGVAIGLMDSQLADRIMRFSQVHERLHAN